MTRVMLGLGSFAGLRDGISDCLWKSKVIFNLTFADSTTELCFPKVMEKFLDHEVATVFMLSFQPSWGVCDLQAYPSQDLLCLLLCD